MSRIARAVFRLTHAFGENPTLLLTQAEVDHLAELDLDELAAVLDAVVSGGVLARHGSGYRAGQRPVPAATRSIRAPADTPERGVVFPGDSRRATHR